MRAKNIAIVLVALMVSGCNELTSTKPLLEISECLEPRKGIFYVLDVPDVKDTIASLTDYSEMTSGFISQGAIQNAEIMNDIVFRFAGAQENGRMTAELKNALVLELAEKVMLPLALRAVKVSDTEYAQLTGRAIAIKKYFEDTGPRQHKRTGKRYSFDAGRGCEANRLVLDRNSVSENSYKDAQDKDLSMKFYRFPQFENDLYIAQSKDNTKKDKYYYNFFIPQGNNIYKTYVVTNAKITVMALYGHAYYSDWSPSPDGRQNGLAADRDRSANIEQQGRIYTAMQGELPRERYDLVYSVRYGPPLFPTLQDRLSGRQEKFVGVKSVDAQSLRAVAYLINQIETGKLQTSKEMNRDLRVVYMEFEPQ